jgi:hypothetical protein
MPLDIQSGTLVEKMRRALGLRGRVPLRCDETLVPVLQVTDLDEPPNRSILDGYAVCCAAYKAADAVNYSFVGIELPSTQTGALVVHGTVLCGRAAVSLRTLFLFNAGQADTDREPAPDAPKSNTNAEFYPAQWSATALPFDVPWGSNQLRGDSAGVGYSSGRVVTWLQLLASDSKYLPLQITLRPGWALGWWNDTINQDIRAAFHGTYYPNAPSS